MEGRLVNGREEGRPWERDGEEKIDIDRYR